MDDKTKVRNLCFTTFDQSEKETLKDFIDASKDASIVAGNTSRNFLNKHVKYLIYGIEICPKTK